MFMVSMARSVISIQPAGSTIVDLVDLAKQGRSCRRERSQSTRRMPSCSVLIGSIPRRWQRLTLLGTVSGGAGEAYGIVPCMASGKDLSLFSVLKSGDIHQVRIDLQALNRRCYRA